MRRIYSLAVLLVMLLASTTAKAQNFEGSVTVGFYESQNYATAPISFSLTAIADAFGISDAATLAAMLDDQYPEDRDDAIDRGFQMYEIQSDNSLFEGIYNDEQKTFTADPIGFYLNKDGDVVTWSSADDIWYYIPRWDAENDEFYFSCGRKAADAAFTEGYTGTATFYLKYNGSIALSFKLTYTVEPKPEVMPNETKFSKLTFVEGVTVNVTQKKRTGFTADNVHVAVPTLLSDLGFATQSELIMAEALYARVYEHDALSDMYTWADSITNESTAGAPGFWFGPTYTYDESDPDAEPVENRTDLARQGYSGDDLFFAESFSFFRSEGADSLSFVIGQYPNNASDDGEEYHATVYIVNGSIAFPINIVLTIEETLHEGEPNLGVDEKVAEIEFLVEKELTGGYATYGNKIDNIDEIVTALGAENPQDLQLWVRAMDGGDELKRFNDRTGSPGDWMDEGSMWVDTNGVQCSWGNTAVCAVLVSYYMSNGEYYIETMERPGGALNPEAPTTFSIFLCYPGKQKYCEVIITWDCSEKGEKKPMSEWTKVKTLTFDCQLVDANKTDSHHYAETYQVDLAQVRDAIGSNDFKLYARYADEEAPFTKQYNCTPYPGFWMDADGVYPLDYGSSNSYGMTFDEGNGVMDFYSLPESRTVGDKFTSSFYLVDETSGKYVELVVNVSIVEEVVEVEVVGEQDIVIAWDVEDGGISYAIADLSEAIETLLEGDASLFESCDWRFMIDGQFTLTSGIDIEWNVFDANGEYLGNQDDANFGDLYNESFYSVGFDFDEQAFGVESCVDGGMGWGLTEVVKTDIAMDYNGKRWIFHCYIGDKETIETGISNVVVNNDTKKEVFDLTGRRVAAPVKGLYIVNGKKVMMK